MSRAKKILRAINPFPAIVEWLKDIFREEYQLDIWYPANQYGNRVHEVYYLKSISKLTATHVKAIGDNNKRWELKTVEPFDYRLQRRH
jgi:hypothetical protein